MEHAIICLEEQQDEFDFKYQTFNMEGNIQIILLNVDHLIMFSGNE